jgi:hypothetical protein
MYGFGYTGIIASMKKLPSGGGALLLDTITDALIYVDLKKQRTAYSGSCIRVRRSSDSAEQDIGFVSNVVDTASLLAFCGAGSGYVVTFYDQSTNGYNLTQSNASKQPRIVNSGVVDTQNSKPTLIFSAAQRLFSSSIPSTATPFQVFSVAKFNNSAGIPYVWDIDSRALIYYNASKAMYNGTELASGSTAFTFDLLNCLYNGGSSIFRLNASQLASGNTGSSALSGVLSLGSRFSDTQNLSGCISMFSLFSANKTSDNTTIETNINTYYGTY